MTMNIITVGQRVKMQKAIDNLSGIKAYAGWVAQMNQGGILLGHEGADMLCRVQVGNEVAMFLRSELTAA